MLPLSPVRYGFLLSLLLASAAFAQTHLPDDLPDAGLPDAAVGGTGAERASQEEEDETSNPCITDHDCDRGFACVNSKCTYRRYRDATLEGCGASVGTGLWAIGAVLLLRRVHFLSKRTK